MLNLLPRQFYRKTNNIYKMRLLSIGFLAISFLFLISFVLMIPSSILVSYEMDDATRRSDVVQKAIESRKHDSTAKILQSTKEKTEILKSAVGDVEIYYLIDKMYEKTQSGKVFNGFMYDKRSENVGVLRLSGVSGDRRILTNLVEILRKEELFDVVNLPFSQLAVGENIEFTLTLEGDF